MKDEYKRKITLEKAKIWGIQQELMRKVRKAKKEEKALDNQNLLCYIIPMMIKNGIEQNVVPTTSEQNLAAAKCEETFPKACLLFRRLEHANNRGTGEHAYDLLEQHFNEKESIY